MASERAEEREKKLVDFLEPESSTGRPVMTEVAPDSKEFSKVANYLRKSNLACHITSIKKVQNWFLYGCFMLKRQEYKARGAKPKVQRRYHCTSRSVVNDIVQNNLNWRKIKRGRYGLGVSFARKAKYSDRYANKKIGNDRAMIVAKVLRGFCFKSGELYYLVPPEKFDTGIGGKDAMVYVKFQDYEFYPEYVVYYSK